MITKRRMRSGVSTITSEILLVSIAVATAILAYFWISSMSAAIRGNVGADYQFDKITIDTSYIEGNTIHIFVRNLGDENISGTLTVSLHSPEGKVVAVKEINGVEIAARGVQRVDVEVGNVGNVSQVSVSVGTASARAELSESISGSPNGGGGTGGGPTGWAYRVALTISNSGAQLSDYQVRVPLDTNSLIAGGKMRSDCGDVRVFDAAMQPLQYWIEENSCGSSETNIYILFPNLPPGDTTAYIYYGNPSATSQSNILIMYPGTLTVTEPGESFYDVVPVNNKYYLTGITDEGVSTPPGAILAEIEKNGDIAYAKLLGENMQYAGDMITDGTHLYFIWGEFGGDAASTQAGGNKIAKANVPVSEVNSVTVDVNGEQPTFHKLLYLGNHIFAVGEVYHNGTRRPLIVELNASDLGLVNAITYETNGTSNDQEFSGIATDGASLYLTGFVEYNGIGDRTIVAKFDQDLFPAGAVVLPDLTGQSKRGICVDDQYVFVVDGNTVFRFDTDLNLQKAVELPATQPIADPFISCDDEGNIYVYLPDDQNLFRMNRDLQILGMLAMDKNSAESGTTIIYDITPGTQNILLAGDPQAPLPGNEGVFMAIPKDLRVTGAYPHTNTAQYSEPAETQVNYTATNVADRIVIVKSETTLTLSTITPSTVNIAYIHMAFRKYANPEPTVSVGPEEPV